MKLWLFDLDGVLVYPGGYRAALKATVGHFTRAMGLQEDVLDEPAMEAFEACGITSEWDSSAICIAALIAGLWHAHPTLRLTEDLDSALRAIRSGPARPAVPDFAAWARRVSEAASGQVYPTDAALALMLDEARQTPGRDGDFAEIERILGLLLARPRDFRLSPTMRVFQHYTLGSREFACHYGIPAAFETPSLLREFDRPALSPASRDLILDLVAAGSIHAIVYTARPCWPRSLPGTPEDFPPEAEIAQALVGLESLPLAGYGHMSWLAAQHNRRPDYYLKPSPVHPLTALALVLGAPERESLQAALDLAESGRLDPPLKGLASQPLEIHVFEDSATGVRGVREAARLLAQAGVPARALGWGIAANSFRRQALESAGARTFADVNAAIQVALSS